MINFQGDLFSLELSEHIFKHINHTCEETYNQCIVKIKQVLNHSKINYYSELVIIKTGLKLNESEQIALVRFLNFSKLHKNKILFLIMMLFLFQKI